MDSAAPAAIRVTMSPVADLGFCLFVVEKRASDRPRGQKWTQSWVTALDADAPELAARIRAFWHEQGYDEWAELSLIGDAAGVLFDGHAAIDWQALERAAAHSVPTGTLATEQPDVREIMEERLRELQTDDARRAAYFALLKEFWAFLAPFYEREGRPAALQLEAEVREQLASGRDFLAVLPPNHLAQLDRFRPMVEEAEREGRLVIIALGLSGVGSGLLEVPGGMTASFSSETRTNPERRREVAKKIAAQLKVLSDPTRLGLLLMLVHGPRSITDLARSEGLSQPTVSVHVKMLREAGLLESEGRRGQRLYFAPAQRVRGLLEGVMDEVQANCDDRC